MNLSNKIASLIIEMLSEEGITEISRNELANELGCVPSQINYLHLSTDTLSSQEEAVAAT